jgi:hypothetical protein
LRAEGQAAARELDFFWPPHRREHTPYATLQLRHSQRQESSQLKSEEAVGTVNQAERDQSDEDLADGSYGEWTPALFPEFPNFCAESYTCERQQECPAGKIRKAC